MKKSYLMIAAAAALFAACSSNDTFKEIDVQETAIGFNGDYVEKATKAEITDSWLTTVGSEFGVFGFRYASGNAKELQLFNNERVYYVDSPADWLHSTVRYWDKSAVDEYYFYAYAPYASTGVTFSRSTGFTYPLGAQVFADAALSTTKDLCIATAVEETEYTSCQTTSHVHFTFSHVLSKLSFKVKKTGFDASHTVRLTSINLAIPTCTTAQWAQTNRNSLPGSVTYTGWTNPTSSTTKSEAAFADATADEGQTINGIEDVIVETTANVIAGAKSYIVTPNVAPADPSDVLETEKHKVYLEVGYDIDYGNGIIDSQKAYGELSILYEQGYHYIVTLNIQPAAIEFHVDAIYGFTEQNVGDILIQ